MNVASAVVVVTVTANRVTSSAAMNSATRFAATPTPKRPALRAWMRTVSHAHAAHATVMAVTVVNVVNALKVNKARKFKPKVHKVKRLLHPRTRPTKPRFALTSALKFCKPAHLPLAPTQHQHLWLCLRLQHQARALSLW